MISLAQIHRRDLARAAGGTASALGPKGFRQEAGTASPVAPKPFRAGIGTVSGFDLKAFAAAYRPADDSTAQRFATALDERLYPRTALTVALLAQAIARHPDTVDNWRARRVRPDGPGIGAALRFFAAAGDVGFVRQVMADAFGPHVVILPRRAFERVRQALASAGAEIGSLAETGAEIEELTGT
jgi:hypothetical protein